MKDTRGILLRCWLRTKKKKNQKIISTGHQKRQPRGAQLKKKPRRLAGESSEESQGEEEEGEEEEEEEEEVQEEATHRDTLPWRWLPLAQQGKWGAWPERRSESGAPEVADATPAVAATAPVARGRLANAHR